MTDPFQKLGIPPASSAAAIKKAYRVLVKTCHPDVRSDKEAASIEFRELTRIYQVALSMAGKAPKRPKPPPPPPPRPTAPIIEFCNIFVDSFEIPLFGEILRDIRVSPQLLTYGGKVVMTLRLDQKRTERFEFEVPAGTQNFRKFRFKHPVGIIELLLVSGR